MSGPSLTWWDAVLFVLLTWAAVSQLDRFLRWRNPMRTARVGLLGAQFTLGYVRSLRGVARVEEDFARRTVVVVTTWWADAALILDIVDNERPVYASVSVRRSLAWRSARA